MKTRLTTLTWRGSASVDPRFSASMLPWSIADIRNHESYVTVRYATKNFPKTSPYQVVLRHYLSRITSGLTLMCCLLNRFSFPFTRSVARSPHINIDFLELYTETAFSLLFFQTALALCEIHIVQRLSLPDYLAVACKDYNCTGFNFIANNWKPKIFSTFELYFISHRFIDNFNYYLKFIIMRFLRN